MTELASGDRVVYFNPDLDESDLWYFDRTESEPSSCPVTRELPSFALTRKILTFGSTPAT